MKLILLCILLGLCACSLHIEDKQAGAVIIGNTGSVSGRVIIDTTNTLAKLRFISSNINPTIVYLLQSKKGNELDSTLTDSSGFWRFDSLAPDTYKIKVQLADGRIMITPNVVVDSGQQVHEDVNFSTAIQGTTSYQGPVFLAGVGSAQITSLPGYTGSDWYGFSDTAVTGGKSYAIPSLYSDFVAMVNTTPGTIQATLTIRPGFTQPFAGVGFDWSNPKQGINLLPAAGLCITYRASHPIWLELPMSGIGYTNQPGYVLSASTGMRTQFVQWIDFAWESPRTDTLTTIDAATHAESLNFLARSQNVGSDSADVSIEIQSVYLGQANCL